MNKLEKRNSWFFGLGTVGRDMSYAFEANALLYFLSNVLTLPKMVFAGVSLCLTLLRIFDALNDPITGLIIDNTNSKYGKFKPPMLLGAVLSGVFYLLLFTDFGLNNYWYVVIFGLAYIGWDITYGINDIAYWSMLPSLTLEQKSREKMGALARICANIGMFAMMVGWQPITSALGNTPKAWFGIAAAATAMMILFQLFTVFGVKEPKGRYKKEEKTTLKELFKVLFQNDQLMWTTLAMALFMVGYCTTTGFAIYYMQYIYGDAGMYAVLAAVVGVAQLGALTIFPLVSKNITREKLYFISTLMIIAGYVVFFFADYCNGVYLGGLRLSLLIIIVSALVIFVAQAFIQLLMLMFLADTIEYGQWKLGKRNESITFSVQPLINKLGGALSTGFISLSLILSGIKTGDTAAEAIGAQGQLLMKLAMFVLPLLFIVAGYVIYRLKFKITREYHAMLVSELNARGDLKLEEGEETPE